MIYIYNYIGVGFSAIGFLILICLYYLFKGINPDYTVAMPLIISSAILFLIDFFYRKKESQKKKDKRLPFLNPHTGGHLFFVPVWILALILLMLAQLFPKTIDHRFVKLTKDGTNLTREEFTGNLKLSSDIKSDFYKHFNKKGDVEKFYIFSRIDEDRVLVLIRMRNLRKYTPEEKNLLADILDKYLKRIHPEKEHYFGFRATFFYTVSQTPLNGRSFKKGKRNLISFYKKG